MKPEHMQTLQDLFRALNQGRLSLHPQGDPALRALVDRRMEAIEAAMTLAEAVERYADVLAEIERATRKFPTWPTDPLHALAVLGEEFGELTKAVLQTVYEPHKVEPGELRTEAIQTAAMALRFLASLDAYRFERSEQHEQGVGNG